MKHPLKAGLQKFGDALAIGLEFLLYAPFLWLADEAVKMLEAYG
jgi:hypothetical protein